MISVDEEGEEQIRLQRSAKLGLRQGRITFVRGRREDAAIQPENPCPRQPARFQIHQHFTTSFFDKKLFSHLFSFYSSAAYCDHNLIVLVPFIIDC